MKRAISVACPVNMIKSHKDQLRYIWPKGKMKKTEREVENWRFWLHLGHTQYPHRTSGGDLKKGPYEPMHPPLQAPIDEQNGGLPHQLIHRFRIARHKRLRITLQNRPAHLRIRRHHRRTPKYMRPEHFPIPSINNMGTLVSIVHAFTYLHVYIMSV